MQIQLTKFPDVPINYLFISGQWRFGQLQSFKWRTVVRE